MSNGAETKSRSSFTPWALAVLAMILMGLGGWGGSMVVEANTRSQVNAAKYDTLLKEVAEMKKMMREVLHNQTEMKLEIRRGR